MPRLPKKSAVPSTTTAECKAQLRRDIRAHLAGIPPEVRRDEDRSLFARFLSLPELDRAQTVFLFYGVGTEPQTALLIPALLERGKQVALPRLMPQHEMQVHLYCPNRPLIPHPFGLLEPDEDCPVLSSEQIDLTLVPALCYDRSGFRLGLGGGYYDRWLPRYQGIAVGLCRAQLLQAQLPTQPHDRPVDMVITPNELICTKEKRGRSPA